MREGEEELAGFSRRDVLDLRGEGLKHWALAIFMGLNQLANAVLGGNPDESISSRVGRARVRGSRIANGVCHFFDWVDPRDGDAIRGDHCEVAVENYREALRKSLKDVDAHP